MLVHLMLEYVMLAQQMLDDKVSLVNLNHLQKIDKSGILNCLRFDDGMTATYTTNYLT